MGSLSAYASPHPGALASATYWIEGLVTGPLATSAALLAVAAVGLGMLNGRIDVRRAVTVVAGCFLVFGASAIVAGLRAGIASADGATVADARGTAAPNAPPPPDRPLTQPDPFDPYAGAPVRQR